jgi:gamma-glutamyl:cysteine ligase YbdK (ATP-grasp superfamily)
MDPPTQTRLWPHDSGEIYAAFNRIFDCRGHGWSNLQSVHINFPFRDDEEFGRLHAAIRMVLPILPAIAASSPVVDGALSGLLDTRLEYYRGNCRKIPSVTGHVIPEPFFSIAEYEEHILGRLYRDIAPFDPEAILQHEWLNARGAIARFDRGAIEIRLLDVQECPRADMAVVEAVVAVVRALADGVFCSDERQRSWAEEDLETILLATIRSGPGAVIADHRYLRDLGMEPAGNVVGARDLWKHLVHRTLSGGEARTVLERIFEQGCLAERIVRTLADTPPAHDEIVSTYRDLADCLASNRMFLY